MLHLSYIAARERRSGEVKLLEFAGSITAGSDMGKIGKLHERLRGPEGDAIRAKYSDVLVVLDNASVASYEFPDPEEIERARKQQQLLEARNAAAEALARQSAAILSVQEVGATRTASEEALARVAALEKELGLDVKPEDPVEEKSPYDGLTIADLKALCMEIGLDTTGFKLRQEYVDALEADEALSALTIPQLREHATAMGLSTSGLKRKRALLDAIEKRERDAAELAALDDAKLAAAAAEFGVTPGATRDETIAAILKVAT